MGRHEDYFKEHIKCCHHCDGRHHPKGTHPYVCAPCWFGQAGAQRKVTDVSTNADGTRTE